MFKKFLTIFVILVAVIVLYFYFKSEDEQDQDYRPQKIETNQEENVPEPEIKQKTTFVENVVVIDGQPMYYAYPSQIQQESPPKLIIYCHGQLQRITEDLEDKYMLKMREYGEFFALKGYIFSASNQHDDNWGGKESLNDIKNSIEWFQKNLTISKDTYIIGFSMGGRTAINYAVENPNNILAIALLAPTPRNNLQKTDVEKLRSISIKIWHGTQDINIPFSTTTEYVKTFNKYGKEIEVIPVENADHFDIETVFMQDILGFFETNL